MCLLVTLAFVRRKQIGTKLGLTVFESLGLMDGDYLHSVHE